MLYGLRRKKEQSLFARCTEPARCTVSCTLSVCHPLSSVSSHHVPIPSGIRVGSVWATISNGQIRAYCMAAAAASRERERPCESARPPESAPPGVQSLMGFSESGLGHLASRIANDFARSGQRRQTLSPECNLIYKEGSQLGALLFAAASTLPAVRRWLRFDAANSAGLFARAALSTANGGDCSFSGWPDAKWPDFSRSTLTAAAVHTGEEAPATPALQYRIRTPASGPRRFRSASPEVPRPSEHHSDRGSQAGRPSKGAALHPKLETRNP
jgi:hypothetical protein